MRPWWAGAKWGSWRLWELLPDTGKARGHCRFLPEGAHLAGGRIHTQPGMRGPELARSGDQERS